MTAKFNFDDGGISTNFDNDLFVVVKIINFRVYGTLSVFQVFTIVVVTMRAVS